MTVELPDKMYPTFLCTVKCSIRPHRYSTLRKPISGYQPQVGSDRVALINTAVRTLGNDHSQQICQQFHHDLRSTTSTDREQLFVSSRVTNAFSSKPRTTRHISNCACSLPKSRPHIRMRIPVQNGRPKPAASTPDMLCPHAASATNRQLWLRQALSAPFAEAPSQEN